MKKAISPVIATLLLILIAVAAAVLVYVWVTGYASSMSKTGAPELQEQIKIEAVSYESGSLKVYIRNIGDIKTNVTHIYVIDAETSSIVNSQTAIENGLVLNPGEVGSTTVDDVTLKSGKTYIIKAVTKNGIEAAISFTPS